MNVTCNGIVVICHCGWRSAPITDRYVDIARVLTAHRATAEHVEDDADRQLKGLAPGVILKIRP